MTQQCGGGGTSETLLLIPALSSCPLQMLSVSYVDLQLVGKTCLEAQNSFDRGAFHMSPSSPSALQGRGFLQSTQWQEDRNEVHASSSTAIPGMSNLVKKRKTQIKYTSSKMQMLYTVSSCPMDSLFL